MKVQRLRELQKKLNKEADRFPMKFSSISDTNVPLSLPQYKRAYIPYFKINPTIFYCSFLFEEYLRFSQVANNKMIEEHTVDYHPSPSELTSRIHPLIYSWSPKKFFSPEHLLNFFSNLYIPPWLQKSFKFMVVRLLGNTIVGRKIESANF